MHDQFIKKLYLLNDIEMMKQSHFYHFDGGAT